MEQTNNYIDFSKIRNFDEIFKDTFEFLKYNWRQFFIPILLYAGPFFALSSIMLSTLIKEIYAVYLSEGVFSFESQTQSVFLISLVVFIAHIIIYGVIFDFIKNYQSKNSEVPPSLFQSIQNNFLNLSSSVVFSTTLLILGFMLYIIPGIILFIPLSFFVYDRYLHQGTLIDSLKRVFFLTRSNLSLTIGTIISVYIILFFSRLLFSLVSAIFTSFIPIVNTILNIGFSIISLGFVIIVIILLYHTVYNISFGNQSHY